jgi:hypothetical protein
MPMMQLAIAVDQMSQIVMTAVEVVEAVQVSRHITKG